MLQTLSQFGSSSSGLGALGFDGKAFLIQFITFVLAFFILKKYAFPPIIKILNERRETIENGVKLGEQMKKEQAELENKVEQLLLESRKKADAIIADAQDSSRQLIRDGEEKARTKAASIISEAEDRIELDVTQARKKLEKELVGLVAETAEAILDEKITATKDTELITRTLKEKQAA